MKQDKLVKAYKTIQGIEKDKYPIAISYIFFKIKKVLADQWEFQIDKEKEIFEKYHPEQQENGMLKFDSPEEAQSFAGDLEDLANLDVDIDFEKQTIKLTEDINLSIEDIEALDEFIQFE